MDTPSSSGSAPDGLLRVGPHLAGRQRLEFRVVRHFMDVDFAD